MGLEEIRSLPPDQQIAVKIELRELTEAGYREDELLWAYEERLKADGETFPGSSDYLELRHARRWAAC